tara:strand:- start:185 stop:1174 length:990 start_codon:yes stop_codon:yes gene_type:complete
MNPYNKIIKPKISIILPVYNGAIHIIDTINSILNQTMTEFELIIINDASKDNSKEIILSFIDSRIIYIENQKNLGQIASLNKGIQLSKTDLIARIDQDDVFLKEKLKIQYEYIKNNKDISVVGTWAAIIDKDNKIQRYMSSPIHHNRMVNTLLNSNPLFHPSVLIRKNIIFEMGMYSPQYKYTEDYNLWCGLVLSGHKIANIPEYLLHYRVHDNQSSQNNNSTQLENALKVRNIFFKEIINDLTKLDKIILNGFNSNELSDIAYTCSDISAQRAEFLNSRIYLCLSIKHNKFNLKSYLMLLLLYFSSSLYQNIVVKKNIFRSKLVDHDE